FFFADSTQSSIPKLQERKLKETISNRDKVGRNVNPWV
ncbi:unnamed protein product, partial [Brassica rapa subsp. trilocularis]